MSPRRLFKKSSKATSSKSSSKGDNSSQQDSDSLFLSKTLNESIAKKSKFVTSSVDSSLAGTTNLSNDNNKLNNIDNLSFSNNLTPQTRTETFSTTAGSPHANASSFSLGSQLTYPKNNTIGLTTSSNNNNNQSASLHSVTSQKNNKSLIQSSNQNLQSQNNNNENFQSQISTTSPFVATSSLQSSSSPIILSQSNLVGGGGGAIQGSRMSTYPSMRNLTTTNNSINNNSINNNSINNNSINNNSLNYNLPSFSTTTFQSQSHSNNILVPHSISSPSSTTVIHNTNSTATSNFLQNPSLYLTQPPKGGGGSSVGLSTPGDYGTSPMASARSYANYSTGLYSQPMLRLSPLQSAAMTMTTGVPQYYQSNRQQVTMVNPSVRSSVAEVDYKYHNRNGQTAYETTNHSSPSGGHLMRETYESREVRVPKKIVRESVTENVIIVPERRITEEIIEEVVTVHDRIIEVAKPIIQEKVIEVDEVHYIEKLVEEPVEVVKERLTPVIKKQVVERVHKVNKPIIQEKIVEYPEIEYRDVPYERIIEIPEIREEIFTTEIPVPQLIDKPIPVDIPVRCEYDVFVKVPVPITADVEYMYEVPRIQERITTAEYPIIVPKFVEVAVPRSHLSAYMKSECERIENAVESIVNAAQYPALKDVEETASRIKKSNILSEIMRDITVDGHRALSENIRSAEFSTENETIKKRNSKKGAKIIPGLHNRDYSYSPKQTNHYLNSHPVASTSLRRHLSAPSRRRQGDQLLMGIGSPIAYSSGSGYYYDNYNIPSAMYDGVEVAHRGYDRMETEVVTPRGCIAGGVVRRPSNNNSKFCDNNNNNNNSKGGNHDHRMSNLWQYRDDGRSIKYEKEYFRESSGSNLSSSSSSCTTCRERERRRRSKRCF